PGELATIYATRQNDGQYATDRCQRPRLGDTETLGRALREVILRRNARTIAPQDWPSEIPQIICDGWYPFHVHAVRDTIVVLAGILLALLPPLRRRHIERRRREGSASSDAFTA